MSTSVNEYDLEHFDDDYAQAEVEDKEYKPVPNGKYQASVARVELTRAKSSGNLMLAWELDILGPNCIGRKLWRNNLMVTQENIKWLKGDLITCGLELDKLSELPSRLNELLDIHLEVTVKVQDKKNNSVYLNKRLIIDSVRNDYESKREFADSAMGGGKAPF